MNLNSRQQSVIYSASLDANKSARQIAKETGFQEHAVRRILANLRARNFIHTYTFLNVYALGLVHYGMFFSLATSKKSSRERLLKMLIDSDKVSFLVELAGEFQLGLSVCCSNFTQAVEFFQSLTEGLDTLMLDRAVALRKGLIHYPPGFLSHKKASTKTLRWGITSSRAQIDETDHKILQTLSQQNPDSISALSRTLGLPLMTVRNRIEILKKKGVIIGNVMTLEDEALGLLPFYIIVLVRPRTSDFEKRFLHFCEHNKFITYLVENFGSWDYELGAQFLNLNELALLIRELQSEFGEEIQTIKPHAVLKYLKVMNYPLSHLQH